MLNVGGLVKSLLIGVVPDRNVSSRFGLLHISFSYKYEMFIPPKGALDLVGAIWFVTLEVVSISHAIVEGYDIENLVHLLVYC